MRSAGSVVTAGPNTPAYVVVGPFPEGSRFRGLWVSCVTQAMATIQFSVRQHQGQIVAVGAQVAADGQSLLLDNETMGAGADVVPCCRLGTFGFTTLSLAQQVVKFNELLSADGSGVWLSFGFNDSIQATSFQFSVDYDVPCCNDSFDAVVERSPAGTVKAPTSAAKSSRAPRVLNRLAVVNPVQSFAGSVPQPVARPAR